MNIISNAGCRSGRMHVEDERLYAPFRIKMHARVGVFLRSNGLRATRGKEGSMPSAPAVTAAATEQTSSNKKDGFFGGYTTQAEYELHRFDPKPKSESRPRRLDTRRRRQPTWPS